MAMRDGFKTLITFSRMNNVNFAEVNVKPFGLDGRGAIDTTSMRNTRYVTKWPKQLTDLTPIQSDCQWNPALLPQLKTFVLLVNQLITITMPNGDLLAFWGWADKVEPQPQKEGEVPIIQFTIIPSNVSVVTVFGVPIVVGEVSPTYNGVAF